MKDYFRGKQTWIQGLGVALLQFGIIFIGVSVGTLILVALYKVATM